MSIRRLAAEQPDHFAFSAENMAWAKQQVGKYPDGRQASAIIPLLWRAQEQYGGWLPEAAIRYVSDFLGMPYIRALEVATFYTMFQLNPVGKQAHIQVCGNLPCMLRGAEDLIGLCKKRISPEAHKVSDDGNFSWEEAECLGACVNAPMVQINADTYEDLDVPSFNVLLDDLFAGRKPKSGSRGGRVSSEPAGGATSLTTLLSSVSRESSRSSSQSRKGVKKGGGQDAL